MLVNRSAEDIVRMIAVEPQELSIDKMREQLSRFKLICSLWWVDNCSEDTTLRILDDEF